MRKKASLLFILFVLVILVAGMLLILLRPRPIGYHIVIQPEEFTTEITNPYLSLSVGKKMVYQLITEEGIERTEILVPGWTKEIMGVETLVAWDRGYLNDELIEDARDYLAQDEQGNVWYFGEDVDNYAGGELVDHQGAWIAGENGALPGILMRAHPAIGEEYRQEYSPGNAEDMARVEGVGVSATVPQGTFTDCVKIAERTPLEAGTTYKYSCSGAAATVFEEEEGERTELIELSLNTASCISLPEDYGAQDVQQTTRECTAFTRIDIRTNSEILSTKVTEEQAKTIALTKVPGIITSVSVETRFDEPAYVIEVRTGIGEIDVIINQNTGEVLAVER